MMLKLLTVDPWAPRINTSVDKLPLTVGCDPQADLRVVAKGVAPRHFRIRRDAGRMVVEDLGSELGTLLNNSPVETPQPLREGDLLIAGIRTFYVSLADPTLRDVPIDVPAEAGPIPDAQPQRPARAVS